MRQEILVFIFDGYADWEPAFVCAELNSPETQYTVKTISLDLSPKVSMGGFRVIPDYSVTDYPKDFALLILTGGYAWLEQKTMLCYQLLSMRSSIKSQSVQYATPQTLWQRMDSWIASTTPETPLTL